MKYFLIAGEASGDLHASNLMHELKKQDADAQFAFLGGDLMAAAAEKEPVIHYRDMAFMGFLNVLKNSRKVLHNMDSAKKSLEDFRPDVLILIDYPSFNLRMARFAKENLNIPVYYYISPKLWAWKEYRIKGVKKWVDKMFTILPFETEFYKKHNYEVHYVGNPSVDSLSKRPHREEQFDNFIKENGLSNKPIIALLPGSRKQEIASCLPVMLEAAALYNTHQVVVSRAPGVEAEFFEQFMTGTDFQLYAGASYRLLQQAKAAVVNSGTATLETALIGTPQVVVYQIVLPRISMMLKPLVIKTKWVSLVNIIAGKEVVRELLGHHFTAGTLAAEISALLHKPQYRQKMQADYQQMRDKLGPAGAAERAAEGIYSSLLLV